ncbi:cytochrome P450 [Tuber indicum]|nr:cytochrome P450 [Tuber indicum]
MGTLLILAICAGATITLYTVSSIIHLLYNIREVRRSGLPYLILPWHEMNLFHVLTCGFNWELWQYLPNWTYLKIFWQDWCHHTKFELFEKYGDVICAVSPGGVTIYVGSVEVARQIYERRNDFPKATKVYEYVRFYGDNVLTLEGAEWRRHNKYTRPPFNEAVNKVVWDEGIKQAYAAVNVWNRKNSCEKVGRDLRIISMNVLSLSNFGVALPFDHESETAEHFGRNIPPGHKMSYGKAVNHVLDNIIPLVISPKWLLRNGPESLKKIGQSYDELGIYLKELTQIDNKAAASDRKNLLGSLAKASAGDGPDKGSGLADAEVIGNAFIFAVAGLETTTGTLHYAIMHLALNPDVQDWLYEDLQEALKDEDQDPSKWDYEKVYPKMAAVLCVIHETLRVNTPHMHIPKWTADKYQPVDWRGKQCVMPPGALAYITTTALHYNPSLWGDTVKGFHPQRWDLRFPSEGWVRTDPETGVKTPITPSETPRTGVQSAPYCYLRTPVKGAFAPFSDGWRACVGKNFALVEMTAVLAVLFRDSSVRIKRREGETQEMADNRGKSAISNSKRYLTVMIRHDVVLEWVGR